MALILGLAFAVVGTATLSGIFGMAGGMILMGIYAAVLPVSTAMILHGVTQLASNGSRSWFFRKHVYWRGVFFYWIGSLVSLLVFTALAIVVDRAVLFLILGVIPLLAIGMPARIALRFERRFEAVICGVVVTALQLVAGVAGPILDVFFVRSSLDRHQIIGTKALTQTYSHSLKLLYYGVLVRGEDTLELPWIVYPTVIVCAWIGTRLGKQVVDRLSDRNFRRGMRWLLAAIGIVYLAKGLASL